MSSPSSTSDSSSASSSAAAVATAVVSSSSSIHKQLQDMVLDEDSTPNNTNTNANTNTNTTNNQPIIDPTINEILEKKVESDLEFWGQVFYEKKRRCQYQDTNSDESLLAICGRFPFAIILVNMKNETTTLLKNPCFLPYMYINYVCFSPDGKYVGCTDGLYVYIWNVEARKLISIMKSNYEILQFNFHNRLPKIICWGKHLQVFNFMTCQSEWCITNVLKNGCKFRFAFFYTNRLFACSRDSFYVWDMKDNFDSVKVFHLDHIHEFRLYDSFFDVHYGMFKQASYDSKTLERIKHQ